MLTRGGRRTIRGLPPGAAPIRRQDRRPAAAGHSGHAVLGRFAGCGGISPGFEAAVFRTVGIKVDGSCANTRNHNLQGSCTNRTITADADFPDGGVPVGGPLCRPSSVRDDQKGRRGACAHRSPNRHLGSPCGTACAGVPSDIQQVARVSALAAAAPPVGRPAAVPPRRIPGCDLDDGRTQVALERPWPL